MSLKAFLLFVLVWHAGYISFLIFLYMTKLTYRSNWQYEKLFSLLHVFMYNEVNHKLPNVHNLGYET